MTKVAKKLSRARARARSSLVFLPLRFFFAMSDEDFILMLLRWGITPTVLQNGILLIVLAALVSLNVYLYRNMKKMWKSSSSPADMPTMDWSQSTEELEIDFPRIATLGPNARPSLPAPADACWHCLHIVAVPRSDMRSRDIECKVTPRTLRFAFRGQEPMLDGTLSHKVKHEECNWQFWPVGPAPTHVKLTLIKATPARWKDVLPEDATGKLEVVRDDDKKKQKQA